MSDPLDDFSRVDIKSIRVLAAWERRLLCLREARSRKTSSKPLHEQEDETTADALEDTVDDGVSFRTCSSRPVTDTDQLPSENNQVIRSSSINFQPCQKEDHSSIPPDLSSRCNNESDQHSSERNGTWDNVAPCDSKVTPDWQESTGLTASDHHVKHVSLQTTVTCQSKSSYRLRNYFLCILLPILSTLSSVRINLSSSSRHRSCKKEPDKLLLVSGLALLLFSPISCLQVGQEPFLEPRPDLDNEPICSDGIYRGNININNKEEATKMSSLRKYWNCSVVEGSISITSAVYAMDREEEWHNVSLPNLVEVTDFVLLYRADEIDSLETLFPKLSVIRGHKLVQFYALAIYQMKNMLRVGLPSLTHIMNGGVRIEKNPLLCYVDTVDWRKIVVQKNDRDSHIEIIGNQEANKCQVSTRAECPEQCSGGCWSSEACQKVVVPCPAGTDFKGQEMCYSNNSGEEGRPCHPECIGGCQDTDEAINNPGACVACNNTRSLTDPRGHFTCVSTCPAPYVAYKNWMCVTKDECSEKIVAGVISMDPAKSAYKYKVHDGLCVDKCPNGFKAVQVSSDWLTMLDSDWSMFIAGWQHLAM